MDTQEYKCGVLKEENKNHKLSDSYLITMDSGFDSIYSGCAPLLMEKSFGKESFDIFSPDSNNRTPIKQCSSALKYHESTPKSIASCKRHLHTSLNISSHKRYKFENNENDPKIAAKKNFWYHDNLNNSACPFKDSPGSDFTPQKNILSSTTNHQQISFINDSALSISKHSTRYEDHFEHVTLPERPSKCQRKFAPLVKNSKRKLDISAADNKESGRKLYFNGTRFLNIIGKLEQYTTALEEIFKRLSSKDLLNVSLVSKQWNSIVKSNGNANFRIQQYLNESQNIKENIREPSKSIILSHNKRYPFSQFNIMTTSKKSQEDSSLMSSSSFFENQNVVQHLFSNERLVKCPRCNKGSIITNSLARLHSTSCISVPTSDLTFSNKKSYSICDSKVQENKINKELPQTGEDYGFCTSVACKFMFCPKCLCDYHPGESCRLSEPESPSKLIVCHKKLKTEKKSSSKSNSKRQSLRRLCFS